MTYTCPRLVLAGTHSGVGKTLLTAGLIRAWRKVGYRVQPFKAGPDYIDPTYHTLAAGRACRNLDPWLLPEARLVTLFLHACRDAHVAVVEGVMGLYDGYGYGDDTGSTAHLARLLQAPVVLVLDVGAMARSAAALALGYVRFARGFSVAGFLLNRVAGEAHAQGVAQAVTQATGLPVFGAVPRHPALHLPERHLGLIPTQEPGRWQEAIEAAAELMARHVDLKALWQVAQRAGPLPQPEPWPWEAFPKPRHPVPLAVARDPAFSFLYPSNLELLTYAGAELQEFRPTEDPDLPAGVRGVILSGGFPEVYAEALSQNRRLHAALRQAHAQGLPIYAECGGLMYLTQTLVDGEGRAYPMVGLLPGRSVMTRHLVLGYREAEAATDAWLMQAGERVRGHEFHFSRWQDRPEGLPPAYWLHDPQGQTVPEGAVVGSLWASYVHLHFWSRPELAVRFVQAAAGSPQSAVRGAQSAAC